MLSKSLLKKTGIYLIGNLSSKLLSALLIPIYAFYITAEDLGYFDFSQTMMGILSPIIVLAIWESILRFILAENDQEFKKKVISTTFIFSISISISFVLLMIVLNYYLGPLKYISMIIVMIVLQSFVFIAQYASRAEQKNKLFITSGIFSTFINFLFIILFNVILDYGVLGLLISYNLGQLSIIILIEWKLKLRKLISFQYFDSGLLKKMLNFSSPLVLNIISAWAISGFGRLIITLKLGVEANGVYTFAVKFSLLITVLGSVITMALIEEAIISKKKKQLDENLNKTIQNLFSIFQILSILAIPLVIIFYYIISDTDYHSALFITPWLLLYAVVNTMASNLGSTFQAIDKTQYQFITTFIGGIVTVILSFLFIDKYGILSVVMAQILGALAMLLSRYIIINKFINLKVNWAPIILKLIIFIIISFISMRSNILINSILELILIIILIIYNKEKIKEYSEKIRRRVLEK